MPLLDIVPLAMPPLPGDWVFQGGAISMLAFVALMIFLGQLVPRWTYKQLERDRDFWRQVALKAIGQNDILLPAAQITTEVTRALSDATSPTELALDGAPASPPERS